MKLGMQVGLGPGHIVLDGDPASPQQRGIAPPQFSAHICCGQMAAWIKMPLGIKVGLVPGNFVLDGDPASPPQKGAKPPPQFSAHSYCGQTTGWIKMALGMEMGLGPGHTVLDSDPAHLLKKGAEPPIFGPFLLWPNGWMRQDATWYGACPQPRRLCVRWGPSPLPKKGAEPPFSAHVYSDQTAAWIKMPLGTEVGLRLRDIV